jgi:hypothetical protein
MDKNRFLIDLSESDRTDSGRLEFVLQSDQQKVFSAVWELESQVNNGGFGQYFFNSDSDIIAHAPAALRAIGAQKCAALVERALRLVFPSDPPTEHNARLELLDALDDDGREELEAFDRAFFGYPDNLTDLLYRYVRQHAENFGVSGSEEVN